jgi:CRISPR-associated protein Cas2
MLYVIAYDITSDARRQKVLNLLRSFGVSTQLSIVECELDTVQLAQLRKRLRALLNPRRDRVSIYPLCARCSQSLERVGARMADSLARL